MSRCITPFLTSCDGMLLASPFLTVAITKPLLVVRTWDRSEVVSTANLGTMPINGFRNKTSIMKEPQTVQLAMKKTEFGILMKNVVRCGLVTNQRLSHGGTTDSKPSIQVSIHPSQTTSRAVSLLQVTCCWLAVKSIWSPCSSNTLRSVTLPTTLLEPAKNRLHPLSRRRSRRK